MVSKTPVQKASDHIPNIRLVVVKYRFNPDSQPAIESVTRTVGWLVVGFNQFPRYDVATSSANPFPGIS